MPSEGCVSFNWMATWKDTRVPYLIWKGTPRTRRFLESANDVLEGSRDEKVLLLQTKLLPGHRVVIGIEDRCDLLGTLLLVGRKLVVAC